MADPDSGAPPGPSFDIGAFLRAADGGHPLLLLDVRSEDEARAWKVEARRPIDTVHVPYFDFIEDEAASVARVPRGRDVVVLCAHGGSSAMVAGLLADAGVPARNLEGGMAAYGEYLQAAEVPLEASAAGRVRLWQINRRGKGCLAYVVAAQGEAAVVDPSTHIAWFEAFAAHHGLHITRVLDTHIHADHVSGGPALAARLGVPYSVCAGDGVELRQTVTPLADGHVLRLGADGGATVNVRVVRTPGHTPGSTSYLVGDRHLLTGDTLFVGGVGRPDLGGHAAEWGRLLFTTLTERLAPLGDEVLVLPAHYAGAHEIGADGTVSGRLGALRKTLPELRMRSANEFLDAVCRAIADPPAPYAGITKVNLGILAPSADTITLWELGKNACAAAPVRSTARE